MWVHRGEILGYGAVADLVVIVAVVAFMARRAWVSISALALDNRGYGQNQAARQRAADLVADGYHGFISGAYPPPGAGRLRARLLRQLRVVHLGGGGYRREVRPAPGLRALPADLLGGDHRGRGGAVSARVELPGATRMERFVAHGRNPHSDTPARVASWPAGPGLAARRTRGPRASRTRAQEGRPTRGRPPMRGPHGRKGRPRGPAAADRGSAVRRARRRGLPRW